MVKPLATDEEVQWIENFLIRTKPYYVTEWGSGGSTIHYPKMLSSLHEWNSIEHAADWYNLVKSSGLDPRVHIHHAPAGEEFHEGQQEWDDTFEQFAGYVALCMLLPSPDLIIVDGRARNACMALSREIIWNGTVILHDADVIGPGGTPTYKKVGWEKIDGAGSYEAFKKAE